MDYLQKVKEAKEREGGKSIGREERGERMQGVETASAPYL